MPIKIEGLCGVIVKDNTLHILFPDARESENSNTNPGETLKPHYPRILMEYEKLTPRSMENVQYVVKKRDDLTDYGIVFLNKQEPIFTLGEGTLGDTTEIRKSFVEMEKVHSVKNEVTLDSTLLEGALHTNLVARIKISSGILEAECPTPDKFDFKHYADSHYQEAKHFHSILNIRVNVSRIQIGTKQYIFSLDSDPIVRIENLPTIRGNSNMYDDDFELVYKLLPNFKGRKRVPKITKEPGEKPLICSLAWFPNL